METFTRVHVEKRNWWTLVRGRHVRMTNPFYNLQAVFLAKRGGFFIISLFFHSVLNASSFFYPGTVVILFF